eukprot:6181717-Pleurochrysis_carterae.AAC.1
MRRASLRAPLAAYATRRRARSSSRRCVRRVEARSTNRRLELPSGKRVDERVITDLEYELTCMIIVSLTSIYVDSDLPCDQMNGHLYQIEYVRSS